MKTIVIISNEELWEEAQEKGVYTRSTLDTFLEEVGFLHATFPDQTMEVVNRRFADRDDILLLLVDESKVSSRVKHEGALSGREGTFPHIYGPLNIDAVYRTVKLEKNSEGTVWLDPDVAKESL